MPMGVSGQAGKSRPETGIVFRDGSELSRDGKTGDVLTEILLNADSSDPVAIVTTFSSPWPLGTYEFHCIYFNAYEKFVCLEWDRIFLICVACVHFRSSMNE